MKFDKESVASALLKGAIIGVGTLAGFAVSKLFRVEVEEDSAAGAVTEVTDSIDASFTEVTDTTDGET